MTVRCLTERSTQFSAGAGSWHLGLQDGDAPYVVPVNYGFAVEDGKRVLYFHGAGAGKKLDLLRRNPNAAFCVDLDLGLLRGRQACSCSFRYESVMAGARSRSFKTWRRSAGAFPVSSPNMRRRSPSGRRMGRWNKQRCCGWRSPPALENAEPEKARNA